jgi:uncharacterized protein
MSEKSHKDEYQGAFRAITEQLAQAGQASLRFDFRGHGDSPAGLDQFTVHNQVSDILSVIDWAQSEAQATTFTCLAASFAAPAAICAAYVLDQTVAKLVLLAPVLDMLRTFTEPSTEWTEDNFGLQRVRAAILNNDAALEPEPGFRLGRDFALDLLLTNPEPLLARLGCEVVLFHGDVDGMVPFDVSREWASAHPSVRFVAMPGTAHGLAEAGDEKRTSTQTKSNTEGLLAELGA